MPLTNGGFETGSYWDGYSGNVGYADGTLNIVNSPVHSGTYALQIGPLTVTDRAFVTFNPPTAIPDAKIGTWVNFPQTPLPNSYVILLRLADASDIGEVDAVFGADGSGNPYWGLRRPDGSQIPFAGIMETSPASINTTTFYHVEIRRKVGNGNAIASLWVNDVELLTNTTETIINGAKTALYGMVYTSPAYNQTIIIDDNELTEMAVPITVTTTGPYAVGINQPVNFSATINGGTPPYTYQISWGDGTATGMLTSTGAVTASHVYTIAGNYTIEIAVQLGGSVFTTATITDTPPPPSQPDILLPLAIISGSVIVVALIVSRKKGTKRRKRRS